MQIILIQEFFGSYGVSVSQVKLVAGLGLMTTCMALTLVLVYLCSRRMRGSQVESSCSFMYLTDML